MPAYAHGAHDAHTVAPAPRQASAASRRATTPRCTARTASTRCAAPTTPSTSASRRRPAGGQRAVHAVLCTLCCADLRCACSAPPPLLLLLSALRLGLGTGCAGPTSHAAHVPFAAWAPRCPRAAPQRARRSPRGCLPLRAAGSRSVWMSLPLALHTWTCPPWGRSQSTPVGFGGGALGGQAGRWRTGAWQRRVGPEQCRARSGCASLSRVALICQSHPLKRPGRPQSLGPALPCTGPESCPRTAPGPMPPPTPPAA